MDGLIFHAHSGTQKSKGSSWNVPSCLPETQVDNDSWRSNVEFQLADSSERQVVRKIMGSLLPPAAKIVKHLGPL